MSTRTLTASVARPALLIVGILLIAANLRAPVTGVAPLLDLIQPAFGLSNAEAGILTTLPLLAFALISPFSALLAREYGLEPTLFGALILIAGGIVMRSLGPAWCLYLGTWVIGSGIAVGNVLLPSLLKRDFPRSIASLTGAYAVTMGVAAALASMVAVPLAQAAESGWRLALGSVIVLPLLAMVAWSPQLGQHSAPAQGTPGPLHGGRIWHSALAWQITLFMGINSFLYYVLVGWLPSIMAGAGYSPAEAGTAHGLLQLASALPGLVLAPLLNRMRDQRLIALAMALLAGVGLLGLLLAPGWSILWAMLFGAGAGAVIILGLTFISLRAGNPQQAAALSGMAQCVGYLLAAFGPPLMGRLHDTAGGWGLALTLCLGLSLAMAVAGWLAGRARQIG
ncbi:MFS transporter [Pseudomonas tohonis]|uniref:MFS transporter n=1 Tax=Pseudomonas tohonis TaxID=2725477 RepID=UPI0021D87BBF|nr:MFS transporter [Pseudomonas tohonis]UXY55167.1 MFS transporter [Pseudomonas tohonis]